jgi:hypothetical protein
MDHHVYRVIEIVGSSEAGVDDAIRTAIARASETLRHIRWFEVVETRGHVEEGRVKHVQVMLKVGFTLEDGAAGQEASVTQMRVVGPPEVGTDPLHEGP